MDDRSLPYAAGEPAVPPEPDKPGSQSESKATYQYKGHGKSACTLAIALLLPLLQQQTSKQGIPTHNPVGPDDPLVLLRLSCT